MNNVDFASYADDNTPFIVGPEISDVISTFQYALETLLKLINHNQSEANVGKCHFICISNVKIK